MTGDAKGKAPRARGLRPFELRLAKLRASKSPECGCGHSHAPGDAHAPSHAPSSSDIPQGGP